ncbi:MAG: ABC transporter permease [Bdellovibrionales bacterium]
MFYWIWLKRVLLSPRNIFQFSTIFSLLSLILGVASLTTAVLAINGFSLGLEKAIVDMSGHIIVSSENHTTQEEIFEKLSPYDRFIKYKLSFLSSEALMLHSKNFKAVLIEGIEDSQLIRHKFLKKRLLKGSFKNFQNGLIVGKSLSEELNLKVGSSASLVISDASDFYFSRKPKNFLVQAIGDFGRYDFNSRYILMPLSFLQTLSHKKDQVSGVRLWLKEGSKAMELSVRMNKKMRDYKVVFWKDLDRNFFEVINMDKKIIFLVLLILIFAAGFNVSSSLFIQVFKRTKDISTLKSLGSTAAFIRNLFLLHGLVLGVVGVGLGLLLGWGICYGLIFLQDQFHFIPEQVYQVNTILLEWKLKDFLFIGISSFVVIFVSSLSPAKKAYKMSVTKGLSYR